MKSTIDQKCYKKLQSLFNLPIKVQLVDESGKWITDVVINKDGSVNDSSTQAWYPSPSRLRHAVFRPKSSTYNYLKYQGRTLRDWGVYR